MSEKHCPSCTCGKRAPVQKQWPDKPAGTISWTEHLECYTAYAAQYGTSQSPERIAERRGFTYAEFVLLVGREPASYVPGPLPPQPDTERSET